MMKMSYWNFNHSFLLSIEVRDVPIPKLIVTTLEKGKNTSLIPQDAFYKKISSFDKGNIS